MREYRNSSGRARHPTRKYNVDLVNGDMEHPDNWSDWDIENPNGPNQVVEIFTDYEGDAAYSDWFRNLSQPVGTDVYSHASGLWRKDLVSGVAGYLTFIISDYAVSD